MGRVFSFHLHKDGKGVFSNFGDAEDVSTWHAYPFLESQWLILDGLVVAYTCEYSTTTYWHLEPSLVDYQWCRLVFDLLPPLQLMGVI